MGSSQSSSNRSASDSAADASAKKASLYQRYQEKKRGPGLSDEDVLKYTGKTREELNAWAETKPGVGKNQLAGKVNLGSTSGLGGLGTADGFGGWGFGAEPGDAKTRGMKFPPQQAPPKTVDDSD
jgi:hypothetical protein